MADETVSGGDGQRTIRFHYIKAAQFRDIHIDGVHGGPTPKGLIQMSVFCERFPIPRETVHGLGPDGTLGPERRDERVAKEGIVRSVEASLIMDLSVAQSLHKWLGNHIEALQQAADSQRGTTAQHEATE